MKKLIILFIFFMAVVACVEDHDHDPIDTSIKSVNIDGKTQLTFKQLYNLKKSTAFGKDTILVGYMVSDAAEGNFFREFYIQNTFKAEDISVDDPRMGIKIRTDLRNPNLKYAEGRKLIVNLEGLKKSTTDDFITLRMSSGNSAKNIAEDRMDEFFFKEDIIEDIVPKRIEISELDTLDLNTVVEIQNTHFVKEELNLPFAGLDTDDFDGKRTLEKCFTFRRDTIVLETSNFADFSDQQIPNNQLNVTGIYNINFDKEPVITMNVFADVETIAAYEDCITRTPNILITEVADPDNSSRARFVELYNAEDEEVNLQGWVLNLYNNGEDLKKTSLDGLVIPAKGFVIIANDDDSTESSKNFQDAFGMAPDLTSGNITGNGNDAYELLNETGDVVDVYGITTEDGTDKDWEYTSSRVYRNMDITSPNDQFTIDEWVIFRDQIVPNDFSPFERESDETEKVIESGSIMMTEIADPDNAGNARYVEVYNTEAKDISLHGWTLLIYENGKTKREIPLDGIEIKTGDFIVIADNTGSTDSNKNFSDSFGEEATRINSNVNGNGDDAYELLNASGNRIDIYGEPTVDGTGQDWEYTDGRAYRNLDENSPNTTFDTDEWTIIKGDKNAPSDFSPFQRKADEIKVVIETASLMITEVADPKDNASARFVEIYNPSSKPINLGSWTLNRYNYTSSKNTKELARLSMDLTSLSIPAGGFIIVGRNATEFNTYFGESVDEDYTNLDGNGDDAYELVDPFDTVIDIYGDVEADGTGANWEYTDGLAKRKLSATAPNATFDVSKWEVQEDVTNVTAFSPRVR